MPTYYLLTGAAGFIGSNLLRALNARGIRNVVAVDNLERADKFANLVDCEFEDFIDKRDFIARLNDGQFDGAFDAVLHQGACSDTMETNGRYMMDNNYRYSVALLDYCAEDGVPFIYASSAAVYGGNETFREERSFERPLNVYGYSKFLFDQIVRRRLPDAVHQIAGFRYFNVYGPNEAHKGRMASVAWHFSNQYRDTGRVRLFAGWEGYADGEQRRDFVSVEDVVRVNLHFLDNPDASGIFNVGTGAAASFNEMAAATVNACRALRNEEPLSFDAMRAQGVIEYIPFPDALKGKYQSYTQADLSQLRAAGYEAPFLGVGDGVRRYMERLAGKAMT